MPQMKQALSMTMRHSLNSSNEVSMDLVYISEPPLHLRNCTYYDYASFSKFLKRNKRGFTLYSRVALQTPQTKQVNVLIKRNKRVFSLNFRATFTSLKQTTCIFYTHRFL